MDAFFTWVHSIHYSNELFSIGIFFASAFALIRILHRAHSDGVVDWSDIITQNGPSNKVALTKLMQLVALFISSWIVIHLTIFDKLTWDVFTAYLAYTGGSEGWSKYLKAKHGGSNDADPEPTQPSGKVKKSKVKN